MNSQFLMTRIFRYCMLMIVLSGIGGCAKITGAPEDQRILDLGIQVKTIDTMQLRITAGEVVLTESMVTPDGAATYMLAQNGPDYRFALYDIFGHRPLFDTLITYKAIREMGKKMVFIQPTPGGDLVWIGRPPASEPPPAKDSIKMSIIYTYTALPDQLKVVVENNRSNATDYTATDSFLLQKGVFSHYFNCNRMTASKNWRLKFYTSDVSRTLVAKVDNTAYSPNSFFVFAFRRGSLSNGVYTLTPEQLY